MNYFKAMLSVLLMFVSSLYSVAQEGHNPHVVMAGGSANAKVMIVTTMDGKKTKLGLKNTPIITIETPYLVYKSDVAEARFELDQLRDIKYEDVVPISGDASGDGVINRADVDETVQYIFGKPSGDFIFSNADTNNDQKVNAADIVRISDLLKNPNINDISKSRTAANSDDQASYSQQHQYALYNYRNDGNFNAWLNLDIDSVTYSRIDTLGVERNAVVVQEVWTPDSLYRIPLEAIDSIGFRAPEPIMREGIFYLTEYHATHTLEIDSLTLYFDTSIDRDRLPSLGQVVLHNTFTSPYDEGFAGRVKTIEKVKGRIKIDCEMLCVGDVYKHLVLVGSAKTMTDEEADVASARTRGYGDPWKKYEDNGEMPIRKIGDLTFNIFDGLISIVSKDPTLQVKYMVYVDEDIFQISANCQLTHNDLQYGLNLNKKKLSEIEDTIEVDKDLKEITQALTRLQNYKEMSAEEWAESILNEKKQKGDKEKLSDDEATVLGRLWDKLHGSWTIPIGGPFVLDLELGPLFKQKGSLELSFLAKTKARNTFYVEARGYTMATLANPKLALATGLAHIDGYSNFHSDPISSISVSAKAKASLSMGFIGKVSVSLIHKSIVHATVSGQGGLKLGGTIEAKWDSESWIDEDYGFNNFKEYFDPLYDMLKDTKIKAELFANFGVELGLTPWSFLSVGAEWEVYNNELGSCYPFPHFSKPSFPVYYHDKEQWSNGNFNNHLVLQSSPTKNIPDLLLGPCNIGMRIIDEEGKTVRETEDREYRDDGTIVWQLFPLQIDLKGLEPGKSYRCYPILHYHDWYKLRATPSYEFTVPEPVSVKQSSLNIKKGDTKDITVSGGWGCYEIINDKNNIVTAYFSDEGEVTNSDDSNNMSEPGGGGGSDWGPPLIWTSSWPTDKTPTLQIKGIDVGEATVQVKDMRSNETTSIKVVVTDEEITPLELSSTLLTLEVGKKGTVTVSSGSGKYTAESSKSDVATVKVSKGKIQVTAIKAGTTTITVTDTENDLTATIEVTVKETISEKESYVVYEDGQLTFYCDGKRNSRSGEIYDIPGYPDWHYPDWTSKRNDVVERVTFDASFVNARPTSTESWFSEFSSLTEIKDLQYLNTSQVVNMRWMFSHCSSLTSLDVSKFDTSNVTDMESMFDGCSSLMSLDVSKFNTSNVQNMQWMFGGCKSLTSLDVSKFNTSNVQNMQGMFGGCSRLTSLDVSKFNTSKVRYMGYMFIGCGYLTSLDVSNFNTSNVQNMDGMFCQLTLTSLDVSNFNTSNVQNMDGMFDYCSYLKSLDLSNFNTSKVTTMKNMFNLCYDLKDLDISSFETSSVTDMKGMFSHCYDLTSLDLSSFNTRNVNNMDGMFELCGLKTIYVGEFWNMENVTNSIYMFDDCTNLVGGKGTKFDSNHTDGEYARIDGGSYKPGYFTNVNNVFTLSGESLTLKPNSVSSIYVLSGSGSYTAVSSNPEVATVQIGYEVFAVTAIKVGSATITVSDTQWGQTKTFTVKVLGDEDAFCLSESSIEIYVNTDKVVSIKNGSGDYDIINDYPDIIEADINGIHVAHSRNQQGTRTPSEEGRPITDDLLYITGKKIGNAVLKIKDNLTGEIVSINVAIVKAPSLTLAKNHVELNVGETENVEILSGSEWYEVTTDNPNVVSVRKATISTSGGGRDEDYSYTGTYAIIEALSAGDAIVTVKDLSSSEELTISVTSEP